MTIETWRLLQTIVDAALDLPGPDRAAYLEQACGGDASLWRRAQELIESSEKAENFFEAAIGAGAKSVLLNGAATLPHAIGRYRIVRVLGEGGMGVVYEAEQDQPRRTVALKLIRHALATPELLRRFDREQQLLGRLRHPGICHIYDAGMADTLFGVQPYFAMELIVGEPLLDYCASHKADLPIKLKLMVRICEAVEHAHQRGIIHRDLKPGNILVDEAGQPKILDFGVARVTDCDTEASRRTDVGQLIGTLAYMSPEQMLADPLELDTRSDVYALGVILYELLAGRLPYDVNGRAVHEAVRMVREDEPAPLRSVDAAYRGDVETIVSKALEKDRSRRYGSAASLADDVERFLRDEPIKARPLSTSYQLKKFARRNRPLVAGVAAVLLTLSAGVLVSIQQAVLATREAATSDAISTFLQQDLLAQASASVQAGLNTKPDPDLKVRTVLDRAGARIAGKFDGQPAVEAAVRHTVAVTYLDLGLFAEAQPHLRRALELRSEVLGRENAETLRTMNALGQSYRLQGAYGIGEEIYRKVVELRRKTLGERHPDTLKSMNDLGVLCLYRDKYDEAEKLHARVWSMRRSVLGEKHRDTLISLSNLALAYQNQGRPADAERLFSQCLPVQRAALGDHHPDTLRTLNNLGNVYYAQGRFKDAARVYSEALQVRRETQGERHPDALVVANNLANVYLDQGDFMRAEQLHRNALAALRETRGEEHPDTLRSLINLAVVRRARGDYGAAEQLSGKVIEVRRRILGPDHPNTLWALDCLARIQMERGDYRAAGQTYTDVIERRRRVLGPGHPATLHSMVSLADLLIRERKFHPAEAWAREAIAGLESRGRESWQLYYSRALLGASLAGQQRLADAEPLLITAHEGLQRHEPTIPAEDRALVRRSRQWLKTGP